MNSKEEFVEWLKKDHAEWRKSAYAVIENYKWFCKQLREEIARRNAENAALYADAMRYRYLRDRDLDTIEQGGVFAGRTPDNVVLNGIDLDEAIDAAMKEQP